MYVQWWMAKYGDPIPANSTFSRLVQKFEETGSVADAHKAHSGRPRSTLNVETVSDIHSILMEEPTTSQRRLVQLTGIPKTSVQRAIKLAGLKPYRPRLLHAINEDDPDRRLEYCDSMMDMIRRDATILDRILFSDEAKFHLSGLVNRHNCVYYADEQPHILMDQPPPSIGINVWAGIYSGGIIGPFFLMENLTGDRYLQLLEEDIIPAIIERELPVNLYLQQDGAPPHYNVEVRQFLNDQFPNAWIGRRGPIEWPARSPDLTPMDFSVWGIIKDLVYQEPPGDIETLKVQITEAFGVFDEDLCRRICYSVEDRLGMCMQVNGDRFEHMIPSS